MKDSIHLKYLITNETDLLWGLTVNSVGYQNIGPNSLYPPGNHPTRYLFSTDRGRILDEYQLLYITRGKGTFTSKQGTDNKNHRIKEGNMFLLFPGEWHNYMPDKQSGWDEYWIGFAGVNIDSRVQNGFFSKQKPIYNVGINNEIVELYRQAIQVAVEQKSGFQQMLAGIVNHLLGLAYSLDKNYSFDNSEAITQINKAKIIILENFKDIRPTDIADKLNMSYSNFRKMFKEYTGFAPSQYIQELKIQKSKELLTNTMIPVKEIAYIMGFENKEYFFTAFKKKNKTTPIEYRKFTQGRPEE
ncbi:MAG: AraC family transcriptional regulator [Prevotella sp.]|jgi:AraC-like DNA-binding protein|nr:AraC family transcriptional regulator [Prevotella sp.]